MKSHSGGKSNKLNQPVELEESSIRVGGKLQNDLDEYDIKVRKSMIGTVNFDKSKIRKLKLCTICEYEHDYMRIMRHIENSHFPREFECPLCGERKASRDLMRKHFHKKHPTKLKKEKRNFDGDEHKESLIYVDDEVSLKLVHDWLAKNSPKGPKADKITQKREQK